MAVSIELVTCNLATAGKLGYLWDLCYVFSLFWGVLPDAECLKTIVLYIFSIFICLFICFKWKKKSSHWFSIVAGREEASQIFSALLFNMIGQLRITKYLIKASNKKDRDLNKYLQKNKNLRETLNILINILRLPSKVNIKRYWPRENSKRFWGRAEGGKHALDKT